ncbi:MAG: NAD-dependent epimerase/dehydratase family protein [Pseudomonadota bacterium]
MSLGVSFPQGSRVLVTGATGFTGQVLTGKLVKMGCCVRAIARSSSNRGCLAQLGIDWIEGDVFDSSTVERAAAGVEYIFHVAAAYREAKITDETYSKVHVESTKLLAQSVVRSEHFKRFIHVSTVGVHGHIDEPPANEEYRFCPGDIYQRTKAEAERWIADFAARSGLPITIIRPAAIYGPGDRRLLKLFRMASKRVFPLFGRGHGLYHLIHVDDLTDIFITAALAPQALGEVYIAGNPEPSRLQDVVKTIAAGLGNSKLQFVRFPVWPLFIAADICEMLCRPFGIEPPLYRRRVAFFTKDRAFDTRKIQTQLGYQFSHTVDSGLRATASWYRDNGWINSAS